MELIKREMPASYKIIDCGDFHIGVANTNEDAIFELVEKVATTENMFVFLKGDLIDAISTTDKRFSLASFEDNKVMTPHQQADRILEILQPIKNRILVMLTGNHEMKLMPVFDCLGYWCDQLGCPWGGYSSKFVHLKDGKPMWKAFLTHGNGSIKSVAKDAIQAIANQRALMKRKLQDLASDCVYMSLAHTHNLLLANPTIQNKLHIIDDGKKIKQTYRVDVDQSAPHIDVEARFYGCSGAFLGTMSQPGKRVIPYSEVAMYSPNEQGFLELIIENHKLVRVNRVVV